MEPRYIFISGIAILLMTMFYLEKQLKKEEIFYLFSAIGIAFGLISVYTVAKNILSFQYFIAGAVICTLIAVLYYENEIQ